jgi:hypothetical protein
MMRKAASGNAHRGRGSTAAFLRDSDKVGGASAVALGQEAKGKAGKRGTWSSRRRERALGRKAVKGLERHLYGQR